MLDAVCLAQRCNGDARVPACVASSTEGDASVLSHMQHLLLARCCDGCCATEQSTLA